LPYASPFRCDVTQKEDWETLWQHAQDYFGGGQITLLVNNAGINPSPGWKLCLDIMLTGVCYGTFMAIEKMSISKVNKSEIRH
jgi:NAD(P)-dependent dehydrogenase (short-subunit alcohol dehydrogenase family)